MTATGTAGAKVEINLPTAGWTDITAYVWLANGSGITIEAGRKDQSSAAAPSTCKFSLNNADGRFSINNVYGAWWGQLSLGVQLRVSVVVSAVTYYRFYGYLAVCNPRWDQSIDVRWAECEAYGQSGRLLNAPSLVSPLRRMVLKDGVGAASYPVAYWPCEGATDTSFASATGGTPMAISGAVTVGTADVFAGSGPVAVLGAGGTLSGQPPYAFGSTRVFRMLLSVPDGGWAADLTLFELQFGDGSPRRFGMRYRTGSGGGLTIVGYDESGTEVIGDGVHPVSIDGAFGFLSMTLTQSGSNINWSFVWEAFVPYPSTISTETSASNVLSGYSFGVVRNIAIAPNGDANGAVVGHIAYGLSATMMATTSVALGYRAESVTARFSRLATETSITFDVPAAIGSYAELLGTQPADKLINICRDIESADGGILIDSFHQLGMSYYSRRYLYGRPVGMTIGWDGVLAQPPTPEYDTQDVVTEAVVTRTGGGSYTYTVTDSRGEFGKSATVNVADDLQIAPAAQWMVHLGQDTEAFRISAFNIDLVAQTSLRASWVAMRPGDRIRLQSPDHDLPQTGELDFLYLGHTEFITYYDWDITVNVSSASPWKVGILGATNSRLGGTSHVLQVSVGTTATSVSFFDSDFVWTTDVTQFPFDAVFTTGEIVSVTAIPVGADPKNWTLVRAVNGVATDPSYPTDISMAHPLRLAW